MDGLGVQNMNKPISLSAESLVKPITPLVDAKEAARILAIGARKLWELTASHEIPSVRIGRAVRYELSDLEAFIQKNKSK